MKTKQTELDPRFKPSGVNKWTAFTTSDEDASELAKTVLAAGVDSGREGLEFWRAFGEIHHVYALRDGKRTLRIVGPGFPPRQFSNLTELEKELKP